MNITRVPSTASIASTSADTAESGIAALRRFKAVVARRDWSADRIEPDLKAALKSPGVRILADESIPADERAGLAKTMLNCLKDDDATLMKVDSKHPENRDTFFMSILHLINDRSIDVKLRSSLLDLLMHNDDSDCEPLKIVISQAQHRHVVDSLCGLLDELPPESQEARMLSEFFLDAVHVNMSFLPHEEQKDTLSRLVLPPLFCAHDADMERLASAIERDIIRRTSNLISSTTMTPYR